MHGLPQPSGKGFDIANARPVMNMTVEDYPDIKMMGPDMPGGDMAWEPQHGPSLMGPQGLGQSQMTAKMYFDEVMGGPVRDFKCTETFIKRMAWRPLPPDPVPPLKPVNGTNGTLVYPSPLPSPSPKPESPNDKPFEVDFSKVLFSLPPRLRLPPQPLSISASLPLPAPLPPGCPRQAPRATTGLRTTPQRGGDAKDRGGPQWGRQSQTQEYHQQHTVCASRCNDGTPPPPTHTHARTHTHTQAHTHMHRAYAPSNPVAYKMNGVT